MYRVKGGRQKTKMQLSADAWGGGLCTLGWTRAPHIAHAGFELMIVLYLPPKY